MTEEQKAQLLYRRQQETYGNKNSIKQTIIENSGDLPADFPKFITTGNYEEDKNNYNEAKLQWIKNNPESYKKLSNKGIKQINQIPNEEFQKMPVEKQQHILNNPGKYEIINE